MLTLLWNLSAAIRDYMRFYMPTNIAIDLLRTPGGLKWAVPVAFVMTPAYLGAMAICAKLALGPGLGWLNLLVMLFFWNAAKFAWLAVLTPFAGLWTRATRTSNPSTSRRPSAVTPVVTTVLETTRR
jgi:hypothetical protein